jgi:hypothetical protein
VGEAEDRRSLSKRIRRIFGNDIQDNALRLGLRPLIAMLARLNERDRLMREWQSETDAQLRTLNQRLQAAEDQLDALEAPP